MHQALQDHTAASLLDAIRQGEGASIEFKSSFQKEVIETLAAFTGAGVGTASGGHFAWQGRRGAAPVRQSAG